MSRPENRRIVFTENYFYRKNGEVKVDSKWHGRGLLHGGLVISFLFVYYRCSTVDTDLNDHHPAIRIFDILGYGGTLHLHMQNSKFNRRYSVGPETLAFFTKNRCGVLRRNRTASTHADTRLDPNEYFMRNPDHQIATHELGGVVLLKAFLNIWRWYQMAPLREIFENYRI